MPIITHIVCDGCQAVKKEVNHWYALVTDDKGAHLQPLEMALRNRGPVETLRHQQSYFCGRRCALEALGCWMDIAQSAGQGYEEKQELRQQRGTGFHDDWESNTSGVKTLGNAASHRSAAP